MLRTNLSTRPFYNTRVVRVALAVALAGVLAFTAYNAAEVAALTSRQRYLAAQANADERRARELRSEGQSLRTALERSEVEGVQLAAREANQLIDRRAFSWTELFNQFEATLPGDVRITSVTPQSDSDGRMMLSVNVISRRVEDLDAFIRRLEETGSFRSVLTRQEEVMPDGMLRSAIQGYYGTTPVRDDGGGEPPATDTAGTNGEQR